VRRLHRDNVFPLVDSDVVFEGRSSSEGRLVGTGDNPHCSIEHSRLSSCYECSGTSHIYNISLSMWSCWLGDGGASSRQPCPSAWLGRRVSTTTLQTTLPHRLKTRQNMLHADASWSCSCSHGRLAQPETHMPGQGCGVVGVLASLGYINGWLGNVHAQQIEVLLKHVSI
jgi:hypothetical protein